MQKVNPWGNAIPFESQTSQRCPTQAAVRWQGRSAAEGPAEALEEDTRRIPREYQENTKGIRREHEGIRLAPPKHTAGNWLEGGFALACTGM